MAKAVFTDSIRSGQFRELSKKYRKVESLDLGANTSDPKNSKEEVAYNARLAQITAGLEPYNGPFTERHVAHLIKRISFGVSTGELRQYRNDTIDQILDRFFSFNLNYPEPINNYNQEGEEGMDPDVEAGATFVRAKFDQNFEGERIISLKTWMIGRVINAQNSALEKMILFWWHFLPIKMWDVFVSKICFRYFKMLERNAIGNFKVMIRDLTLDPGMLIFLSGAFNNKYTPDENFARELQELFCIGKGKDAAYTEEDVRMTARVLTGWTVDWESVHEDGEPISYFNSEAHHTGDKRFSAFYGNKVISGKAGDAGAEELDELLDMIFSNPECAKHLARKLYGFFVTPEITAQAERLVITPLAQVILQHNFDILPALRVLLKSAHFYHQDIIGVVIKTPLDFTLGFWKSFNMRKAASTLEERQMYEGILWQMANLGMEIGDPPNVAGWPPFYQSPMYDKIWINTDTIARRTLLTDSLVFWGFRLNAMFNVQANVLNFVNTLANPEDPNSLIKDSALVLLGVDLGPIQFEQVKQVLLSGQEQDYYWTGAWLTFEANPSNLEARTVVLNRLNPAFQLLLQMAETHLM
ncbi:DUF1800 domain-containing protein [Cecembia lonarensis]|uniref:DUF1800 domain-containing protein n=1 Tax=Cecembia lonarensis (strain CCUG 58316 / KCTC 22772 / LW9) TaxID=1225176 RepID=K1LXD4_CECL9|nr:DUF1800 family protein [Cecembia lonarensis]EKB48839.1 hypothetical protein B879_02551 [Cecembia lonarensis LW9]